MGRTQLKQHLMSLDIIRNIEKLFPKVSDFYYLCFEEQRLPMVEYYSAMRHEYHRGDVIDLIEANYWSFIQDTPYSHEDFCLAPRIEDIQPLLLESFELLKKLSNNPVTCDPQVTSDLIKRVEISIFILNCTSKYKVK
jgi:hypothetical protein